MIKGESLIRDNGDILALELRLTDAMRTSNIEHLDFLLHDDLLFVGPDGTVATKVLDMEKYRSASINFSRFECDQHQVTQSGDVAIVSVRTTLNGTLDGESFGGVYRYLRVWKQTGDDWKVIAGSCVALQG